MLCTIFKLNSEMLTQTCSEKQTPWCMYFPANIMKNLLSSNFWYIRIFFYSGLFEDVTRNSCTRNLHLRHQPCEKWTLTTIFFETLLRFLKLLSTPLDIFLFWNSVICLFESVWPCISNSCKSTLNPWALSFYLLKVELALALV